LKFLHIGKQTVIDDNKIIGIFDLEITSQSYLTREYLAASEKRKEVITVSEDIPKTFIVCTEKNDRKKRSIYLSQMSTATLIKRAEDKESLI